MPTMRGDVFADPFLPSPHPISGSQGRKPWWLWTQAVTVPLLVIFASILQLGAPTEIEDDFRRQHPIVPNLKINVPEAAVNLDENKQAQHLDNEAQSEHHKFIRGSLQGQQQLQEQRNINQKPVAQELPGQAAHLNDGLFNLRPADNQINSGKDIQNNFNNLDIQNEKSQTRDNMVQALMQNNASNKLVGANLINQTSESKLLNHKYEPDLSKVNSEMLGIKIEPAVSGDVKKDAFNNVDVNNGAVNVSVNKVDVNNNAVNNGAFNNVNVNNGAVYNGTVNNADGQSYRQVEEKKEEKTVNNTNTIFGAGLIQNNNNITNQDGQNITTNVHIPNITSNINSNKNNNDGQNNYFQQLQKEKEIRNRLKQQQEQLQQQQLQQQQLQQQQLQQQQLQQQQLQQQQLQQQQLQQQQFQQQQLQFQQQHQLFQQHQQQEQTGGLKLTWDGEDFAEQFQNYGAVEMKVRRDMHPTTGEPWPMPQYYTKDDKKVFKVSKDFQFIPTGIICDVLEKGIVRHTQRTLEGAVEDMYDNLQHAKGSPIEDPVLRYNTESFLKAQTITRVEVKVQRPCTKYPSLESDESYDLVVKKNKTYIWANEVWGAIRGMETFGQLVWIGVDGSLYIKETVINDYPRFSHRGILVDTSRHYLFKEVIFDILDSMEMNKLNVFHWHIVDDQSFPYESKVFPNLSRKGAFHPTFVYSLEVIAEIIEYARLRGIRVMPEFDTPGHTYSWGLSKPDLLTQCYSHNTPVKGYLGPIDPSKNATYIFLQKLFKEIVDVFKDRYLHLGGDEVPLGCWQSNPEVMAFAQDLFNRQQQQQQDMRNNAWSQWSDNIRKVYEFYENRLMKIISDIGEEKKKKRTFVMWQEVMNNNLQLPNDTIIQIWMGDMGDVMRAISRGYQVLYSTCWYMDHIEYGTKWPKYYNCDPADKAYGYSIDETKVLGGEACFWSEYFSNENLIPLMWPRASAAAERLWSSKTVRDLVAAGERLSEHRCRMLKRGINAGEINGPGYCLHKSMKQRVLNETPECKVGNCKQTFSLIHEDIQVVLSQRGGTFIQCVTIFTSENSNVIITVLLVIAAGVGLFLLSKSSANIPRMRACKNRSILIVFITVIFIYVLFYTTIWMQGFTFTGSFKKILHQSSSSSSVERLESVKTEIENVDS